jgi:DNA-binding NarL/FixJ family response regulator
VPIRIVLAEDNLLVREGVRRLLEAQVGLDVLAVCGDFDALLATVEHEHPDVVITDIRIPPTGTTKASARPKAFARRIRSLESSYSVSTMIRSTR